MNCTCGHSLFGHEAVPQAHLSGAPLTLSGRCESYGCMCGKAKPGDFTWADRLTPPKNQCAGGCGREVSSAGLWCSIGCIMNARQRELSAKSAYPTHEALKNELAGIRLFLGIGPDGSILERLRSLRKEIESLKAQLEEEPGFDAWT